MRLAAFAKIITWIRKTAFVGNEFVAMNFENYATHLP
jgi:hypothetical protein